MRRLLAALVLTACAAGCRNAFVQGVVVLRVANWGGAGDDSDFYRLVRDLYAEFEEANPGIKIQVEGIPNPQDYVSKVLLSHVARSAPDIITLDASSAAVFIENDVLRDLSPYIAKDQGFRLDDYFPNVVDITRRGDKLFAIPGDFTPMVVYFNKAHFDEAGVPYPRAGWNRDDFLQTAKKLTANDRFGFVFTSWMPGWIMWLWNSGGDVLQEAPSLPPQAVRRGLGVESENLEDVVLDSEANVRTLEWLRDLILVHKVAPSLSAIAAQGVDPFANGDAAMQVSGHWSMVGLKATGKIDMNRLGIVPFPADGGSSKTVMYESGFAIGKLCKNPDAAWKFIKFMTSKGVQMRYQSTGIAICARKDVAEARATTQIEKDFLAIVPSARGPWGAKVVGYDIVEDIGQKMMDSIIKNGVPVPEALKKAAKDIQKELAKK